MPLCCIDVVTQRGLCANPEGVEVPDDAAARRYAEEDARDLLNHIDPGEWEHTRLVLKDEGGAELASVPLQEAAKWAYHRARAGTDQPASGTLCPCRKRSRRERYSA